jgi:hypothetical protein
LFLKSEWEMNCTPRERTLQLEAMLGDGHGEARQISHSRKQHRQLLLGGGSGGRVEGSVSHGGRVQVGGVHQTPVIDLQIKPRPRGRSRLRLVTST